MAQKIINVGTATNDGTGDTLRDGAIKVNDNFTELYSLPSIPQQTNQNGKFLSTNGSTLVWTTAADYSGPVLPSVLNNAGKFLTTDGSATSWGSVNYNNLTNKPTIPAVQVSSDWNASSGVTQILNKPTIPAAQVQSDWNAVSGLGVILNKPTIPAAQVSSDWNASSGVTQILNKPTILNLQTRVSLVGTTSAIAANASQSVTITGFKGYALYSVQTSAAAWVTIYNGATARTNDSARVITTDPTPGSGVIAEVITAGASTYNFAPAIIGYSAENTTSIQLKVSNQSVTTQSITVTLTLIQLEA